MYIDLLKKYIAPEVINNYQNGHMTDKGSLTLQKIIDCFELDSNYYQEFCKNPFKVLASYEIPLNVDYFKKINAAGKLTFNQHHINQPNNASVMLVETPLENELNNLTKTNSKHDAINQSHQYDQQSLDNSQSDSDSNGSDSDWGWWVGGGLGVIGLGALSLWAWRKCKTPELERLKDKVTDSCDNFINKVKNTTFGEGLYLESNKELMNEKINPESFDGKIKMVEIFKREISKNPAKFDIDISNNYNKFQEALSKYGSSFMDATSKNIPGYDQVVKGTREISNQITERNKLYTDTISNLDSTQVSSEKVQILDDFVKNYCQATAKIDHALDKCYTGMQKLNDTLGSFDKYPHSGKVQKPDIDKLDNFSSEQNAVTEHLITFIKDQGDLINNSEVMIQKLNQALTYRHQDKDNMFQGSESNKEIKISRSELKQLDTLEKAWKGQSKDNDIVSTGLNKAEVEHQQNEEESKIKQDANNPLHPEDDVNHNDIID